MKKFAGNRPLKDIKAAVKKYSWPWNQKKYDGGSDYVTFGFIGPDKARREVVYNTFTGGFIVKGEGDIGLITERSTEMDGVPWYDALLNFIYLPEEKQKKKPRKKAA